MRVILVVGQKYVPSSYGKMTRRVVVKPEHRMRIFGLMLALAAIAAVTLVLPASSDDDNAAKVKEADAQSVKAAKVFYAIMEAPDKGIPQDLIARAKAIAVFPQVIKASFVIGGEGGRGVVSRRASAGWSNPVFFRAGGPSVGWQIGASATDFVLLFMNDDAVSHLMKDKFALGAEAAVAGGPVGREAGAGTDAMMHAEILSYSRSRGLFAGISLKGVVVRPEDDLNQAVYSKSARELLNDEKRGATNSEAGLPAFPQAIAKYGQSSGSAH
jgi:lipid-binding SYLF domain-containing protein